MKILFLLGALAVAVAPALAPGDASAALENLDFSTTYNGGPYSGDTLTGYMLLDVVGGSALSGTLSITGVGLVPTTVTMGLVRVGEVYEAGDGTELFAEDDKIPIELLWHNLRLERAWQPVWRLHAAILDWRR